MGAYLSFSRGAIAVPARRPGRARRLRPHPRAAARGGDRARRRARSPAPRPRRFGAVRALTPRPRHGAGLAVLALLAVVAARRGAPAVPAATERPAPLRLRAAPVVAVVVALALLPYAAVVLPSAAAPRAPPPSARPTRGCRTSAPTARATGAWRSTSPPTIRSPAPGRGLSPWSGCAGATIDERVRNAHSLELQTLADLGLVGLALLAPLLAAPSLAAPARPTRRSGPSPPARRRRADLGPARRPGLGLGDARAHPRRGRPRRAPAVPGRRGGPAPISSATQAALEAQGQRDDDGDEERDLGDRLGRGPA